MAAGDSPLCPQTTASPSSVPSSLLHVSKVSSIFGARPPQPRENVLGISFKPYSPESGPALSPCSACESTRKDGGPMALVSRRMGRDGGRQGCHRHGLVFPWGVRGKREDSDHRAGWAVCGPVLPQPRGGQQGLGAPRRQLPPDPASALLPGSSMFRAPCMSQRRLALIFCVSVLIVLLIALILLCEWGPSPEWLQAPGGDLRGAGGQQSLGIPTLGSARGKPLAQRQGCVPPIP